MFGIVLCIVSADSLLSNFQSQAGAGVGKLRRQRDGLLAHGAVGVLRHQLITHLAVADPIMYASNTGLIANLLLSSCQKANIDFRVRMRLALSSCPLLCY